jgi:hypothetical protein
MARRLPILHFAFFCILISLCAHSHARESHDLPTIRVDERTLAAAMSFVEAARNISKKDYANIHFVVVETKTESKQRGETSHVVTRYEFWSRDNRFFRLDSRVLKSNDPRERVGARLRLIVQPEGYVNLRAMSQNEPFTIRDWGDSETGWSRLFGIQHLRAATRYKSVLDADVMVNTLLGERLGLQGHERTASREVGGESELISVNLSKEGSLLELNYQHTYRIQSTDARYSSTDPDSNIIAMNASLVCDVRHGVVRHYEAKNYDGRDSLLFTVDEDKAYDFGRFGPYPSQAREAIVLLNSPYGRGVSRETNLQLVEWNTATPLGFFSLEAQGFRSVDHGAVWGRRLLIAAIGIALFFVTVIIKRWRHAND